MFLVSIYKEIQKNKKFTFQIFTKAWEVDQPLPIYRYICSVSLQCLCFCWRYGTIASANSPASKYRSIWYVHYHNCTYACTCAVCGAQASTIAASIIVCACARMHVLWISVDSHVHMCNSGSALQAGIIST